MTENECIEILKNNFPKTCKMVDGRYKGGFDDAESELGRAFLLSISALSEIHQYRAIVTVEECREAMERQRAKKPNGRYKTRHMWDGAYCPMCRCGITARWNFCQSCGQAIDWSDTP